MSTPNYSTETLDRIKKLDRIRSLGVNPFATKFDMTNTIGDILARYPAKIEEGTVSSFRPIEEVIPSPTSDVAIAGRVMLHRSFGKICFASLSDGTGRMQVLFSRENCSIVVDGELQTELSGEAEPVTAYKFAEKLIDLGDFIGVRGELFYTHKGELTLFAKEFTFLTKAIRPLPEKFHGMENDDERYRKRYLDMAMDDALRAMFVRKSNFWRATRDFMVAKGFLEVETPTIEHTTGGAEARPFATHHNDYDVDVYMRICVGELWQKRLMAGGFPKTFEIGRAYRNEGSSPEHLQEFTNMEFYWGYADYEMGMRLVQELYQHIAMQVYGKTQFTAKGHTFDLAGEWPRVDYLDIVGEKTGINLLTATDDEMRAKLAELGVKYEGDNRERLTDTLWKYVRKTITGPAFLVNHPQIISPLAKASQAFPGKVERFQPIIAGSEVGNGFSELNDPLDQRARFELQQELLATGDDEAMMPEWDFVEMLEHGMPPTCGFGFGERFFAFLEDKPIREVQYFPFMKPVIEPVSAKENEERYRSKKIIVIADEHHPAGIGAIANAIGQLGIEIGMFSESKLAEAKILHDADGRVHYVDAYYGMSNLSGSQTQMSSFVMRCHDAGIQVFDFSDIMRKAHSDKEMIEGYKAISTTDIGYMAVGAVVPTDFEKEFLSQLSLFGKQ